MGASDSITNCLHRYSIQAVTIFDFPLSSDWRREAESVATLLETFSEYGTQRESTKYHGGTVRTFCHCLVFANVHPFDEVAHRDVVIVEAPPLVSDSQASTVPMGPRFFPGVGIIDPPLAARDRSRSRQICFSFFVVAVSFSATMLSVE